MPSDTPSPISKQPTAYMVRCSVCGPSYLTGQEYSRQLSRANRLWQCPQCGGDAAWDDDNFEAMTQEEPPMPDPTPTPHARLAELVAKVEKDCPGAWTAGAVYTHGHAEENPPHWHILDMNGRMVLDTLNSHFVVLAHEYELGNMDVGTESIIKFVAFCHGNRAYFLALMAESEASRRMPANIHCGAYFPHCPDASVGPCGCDQCLWANDMIATRLATDLALESTRTAQGGA